MKNLNDFTEKAISELFDRMGAFFGFSKSQFNECKKEGVEYVSVGGGLLCPKENVQKLVACLVSIRSKGIEADLTENGKAAIIERELYNHECFYTGRIDDCVGALSGYPITREEIAEVFNNVKCEKPGEWFCGIENLTSDPQGYIYWKGIRIEHYSYSDKEKEIKAAKKLAMTMQKIEADGKEINMSNYFAYC